MNYGWPNIPQGIKLFHVAHQKDTFFKTTFSKVSGQNLCRDPPVANLWKQTHLERYVPAPLEKSLFYQIHTLITYYVCYCST